MVLQFQALEVSYGKRTVLHDLSLEVGTGRVRAIIGPNGAGKSTLLKALAGIISPISGQIILNGKDITRVSAHGRARMGIGYVMQGGGVFPSLSVAENLSLAVDALPRDVRQTRIQEITERIPHLASLVDKQAAILSGGQRMFLALAMGLVRTPQLLLLDEPSAGLAPSAVPEVLQTVVDYAKRTSAAVLLVEQNVAAAKEVADSIVMIVGGRIQGEYEVSNADLDREIERAFFGATLSATESKEGN